MKKKIATRLIIGIVAILALFFGYRILKDFTIDPDLGEFNSVDHILAIEYTDQGSQAVIFTPSGEKLVPKPPKKDRFDDIEAYWSGDGQRVFISSNRESTAYNIYRWNPEKDKVEKRSEGTRSQSAPWFGYMDGTRVSDSGLITSGGQVLSFDPRLGTTSQVLPPPLDKSLLTDSEGGSQDPIEAIYGNFGKSFIKARYAGAPNLLFASMRHDTSEVLLMNDTLPDENGQIRPQLIFRAKNIDFDAAPDGSIGMVFKWFMAPDPTNVPPEMLEDGKFKPPFYHGVFKYDMSSGSVQALPIIASNKPTEAFGDIAVSPDGSKIAVVIGEINKENVFKPIGLAVMPFEQGGAQAMTGLTQGNISSPSWSPDGSKLVFIMTEGDDTNIYTISTTGSSGPLKIGTTGQYAKPFYSPQLSSSE